MEKTFLIQGDETSPSAQTLVSEDQGRFLPHCLPSQTQMAQLCPAALGGGVIMKIRVNDLCRGSGTVLNKYQLLL